MALAAAQMTQLFKQEAQMGILAATRLRLQQEGISNIDDLAEFYPDDIKQLAETLRKPGGRVADPNDDDATIPTPPFQFGARSIKRLTEACHLVRFYETTGQNITATTMQYQPVCHHFAAQWKSLEEKRRAPKSEVPKSTKELGILAWTKAFNDFLADNIGARCAPLACVIRETEATAPADPPPLATNRPHTTENGSAAADLVAHATHDHPLFNKDNHQVHFELDKALRTTVHSSSLKPYQRTKDGRGACQSTVLQCAGNDKWESELKRCNALLTTGVWKGNTNFKSESFVNQHRVAFINVRRCAEHVPFQLPLETTRVSCLLNAIECKDPELQAAIANVRMDNDKNGKLNNFKLAATHLAPRDPVARKRKSGTKRPQAEVSTVETTHHNSNKNKKPRIGVTGVELRFHKANECRALNKLQKSELHEWRQKTQQKGKATVSATKASAKDLEAMIASALTKKSDKLQSAATQEEQVKQCILNVVQGLEPVPKKKANAQQKVDVAATAASVPLKLKSILKTPPLNGITAGVGAVTVQEDSEPIDFDEPTLLATGDCPDPASMLEDEEQTVPHKKVKDGKKKGKKNKKE